MSDVVDVMQDTSLADQILGAAKEIPTDVEVIERGSKPETGFKVTEMPLEDEKAEKKEDEEKEEQESSEEGQTTEEPKAEEEGSTDEETSEPEIEEPEVPLYGKDLVRHLRGVHKSDAKTAREQEAKISQLQSQLEGSETPAAAAATTAMPPAQRIAPADIFRGLVEVNSGDRTQADLPIIQENIGNMTMQDLSDVTQVAQSNGFGNMSADILAEVQKAIPTVMVKDAANNKTASTRRDWESTNRESWDDVKSIPGMNDPKSKVYKDFVKAEASLLKTYPDIKLQADAPMRVIEHMDLLRRASSVESNSTLKKENEKLRKQLNIGQGGLDSTGSASTAGTGGEELSPKEELAQAFATMGYGA